jgi:hypothetical protein
MQRTLRRSLRYLLAAGVLVAAATAQQAPPQQAPADSDALGERVTVIGMVPPPDVGEGAPYHAPEEIAAIGQAAARDASEAIAEGRTAGRSNECRDSVPDINTTSDRNPLDRVPANIPRLQGLYRDKKSQAQKVSQLAGKAEDATEQAEDARRDAAQGANNKSIVEKTELARQKAVNALEKARLKLMQIEASIADYGDLTLRNRGQQIEWADLDMRYVQRRQDGWGLGVPKESKLPLSVVNMQASEYRGDKGYYLRLTGVIVNIGDKPLAVPDFVVSVLDEKGFPLRNVMASVPSRIQLPPGGVQPFSYDVQPSPRNVGRIVINFASGSEPPPELPVSLLCGASPPSGG